MKFLGRIRALDISNNDKYFASTANDSYIRLYETRTGNLLHLLSGRECFVMLYLMMLF